MSRYMAILASAKPAVAPEASPAVGVFCAWRLMGCENPAPEGLLVSHGICPSCRARAFPGRS